MTGGKTTSFDIAYRAGVSQPTVSRALRGDKAVSLATRAKIERIARELNYAVDRNASCLRSRRTDTVALLFFEDPAPDASMINPFYLAMLGSITRACGARGLDLLVSYQRMEDDWHRRYQESRRADGLILLGYGNHEVYAAKLAQLATDGTHFTRWGPTGCADGGATIGSDNLGAGRTVGEHLLERGRRRIAFLGRADASSPEFAHRLQGLRLALREAGIDADPALQHDAVSCEEAGHRAALRLLDSGEPFDAVFAASDLIAIGALRALAERGLRVPEEVALAGFDNIPASALTQPALTTVMQDTGGAGDRLVEALLAQIEGRAQPPAILPTKLIVRASS